MKKKINKMGLAALLLAVSLGGYSIGMESVHGAEKGVDISQDISDAANLFTEDPAGILAGNSAEITAGEEPEAPDSAGNFGTGEVEEPEPEVTEEKKEPTEEDIDTISEKESADKNTDVATEGESCGAEENTVFWLLDSEGTLKIFGQGAMQNWNAESEVPWNAQREKIKKIQIVNGVTTVGAYAFSGCVNVVETEIPDSIQEIGEYAFFNCSGLSTVTIG